MSTWTKYSEHQKTEFLAGVLPRRGVHYLCGPQESGKTAILADLVVALAAGSLGCGLGPAVGGVRESLAGWFGHTVGAPSRVAVVSSAESAEAFRASIEANALARGVTTPLPLVFCSHNGRLVDGLMNGDFRWLDARDALGGSLDLIVILTDEHERLSLRALNSTASVASCPVLVAVCELPSGAGAGSVILETSADSAGGTLTLAQAVDGAGWSRRFSLDRVSLRNAEASVATPGQPIGSKPRYVAPAPVPQPRAAAEAPIVSRLVFPIAGYDISDAERARWPGHRWAFTNDEIVSEVKANKSLGRTEVVIAFGPLGGVTQTEVNRIETALLLARLAEFASVVASEQRLLPQE
jgi:hypothetical protein